MIMLAAAASPKTNTLTHKHEHSTYKSCIHARRTHLERCVALTFHLNRLHIAYGGCLAFVFVENIFVYFRPSFTFTFGFLNL